jgi:hypothetical protein
MLVRLISPLVLLALPSFVCAQADPPRQKPPAGKAVELKPFTVSVVEAKTGMPVTEFWYDAGYRVPGRVSAWKPDWKHVEAPTGTLVVQAPASTCLLGVGVDSREFLRQGFSGYREFKIIATDRERRGVIELERGITAHGTVRDADTRQPIAGAIVKASIMYGLHGAHVPPGPGKRESRSDKDGHFELPAVDPDVGIAAFHPDYGGEFYAVEVRTGDGTRFDVELPPVESATLRGTVRDTNRQPLEGVSVFCDGKEVRTARDGTYSFKCALGRRGQHAPTLSCSKDGYVTRQFVVNDIGKTAEVVLERQIALEVARLAPGSLVTGKILAAPSALTKIEARLVPRWPSFEGRVFATRSGVEDWLIRTTTAAADGTLNFEHVRPDKYTLFLKGPGVTARLLAVDVPRGGLDLGQIRLAGRGRIRARVFESKGHFRSHAFDFGQIKFLVANAFVREYGEDIDFMTDDQGRVSVEDVPVGQVLVCFEVTPGMIEGEIVEVFENQTTETRLFGPKDSRPVKGSRPVNIEITIGDGSKGQGLLAAELPAKVEETPIAKPPPKVEEKPIAATPPKVTASNILDREVIAIDAPRIGHSFQAELIPLPGRPLSCVRSDSVKIDGKGEVVLPDVSPGQYSLRLFYWDSHVVYERDLTVAADAPPIKVSLGAGSIRGIFGNYSEIIATPHGAGRPIQRSRYNLARSHWVPFLPPGTYTLFVHASDGDWGRVDNVTVGSSVTDVGQHSLVRGGTISGSISFRRPCPIPDEVIATGPSHVSLPPISHLSSFDQFEVRGLWPGRWTITVRGGRQVLATAVAEITGTETLKLECVAEPEKGK